MIYTCVVIYHLHSKASDWVSINAMLLTINDIGSSHLDRGGGSRKTFRCAVVLGTLTHLENFDCENVDGLRFLSLRNFLRNFLRKIVLE